MNSTYLTAEKQIKRFLSFKHLVILSIFFLLQGCYLNRSIPSTNDVNSPEMADGMRAFQEGDYPKARSLFTKMIEQKPGSPELEEAQWFLIQISDREKNPRILYQYELFLTNFPSSRHAAKAKERIKVLTDLKLSETPNSSEKEEPNQKKISAAPFEKRTKPDRLNGSLITEYLYDDLVSPSPTLTTQNRLSEFVDLRWRKGSGTDVRVYFSGAYSKDFLNDKNTRTRLSKLFVEWNNSGILSNFRVGRQPASGNTLFSRYDGISFAFPIGPFTWNTGGGFPVDLFNDNPVETQTYRKFYESYLSVFDFYHLGGKVYFTEEYAGNFPTRQAVGLNSYWIYNNINISTILDRDLDFNRFNDLLLNVEYSRNKMRYFGSVEYRRNPFLDYNSALFDPSLAVQAPPVTTLDALQQMMTREQIQDLAIVNSIVSLDYGGGIGVDLSSVWHSDFRVGKTLFDPENLSDNILTFPSVHSQKSLDRYSIFIAERNGFGSNEVATALLSFQNGSDSQSFTGIAAFSKTWAGVLQGGLRFRWEDIQYKASGTHLSRMVPGFIFRFSLKNGVEAGIEADYAMEQNNASPDMTSTIQTRASLSVPF